MGGVSFLIFPPLFLSPMFLFFSLCIKTGERAKKGKERRGWEREREIKRKGRKTTSIFPSPFSPHSSLPQSFPLPLSLPSLFVKTNGGGNLPFFFFCFQFSACVSAVCKSGSSLLLFLTSLLVPSSPPHSSPRFCFKRKNGKGREREGGEMIKKSSFYFFFLLLHYLSLLRPQNATHTLRLTPLRSGHSREPQPPAHPQRDLRLVPGALCALQNASHHLEGKNASCSDRSIVQSEIIEKLEVRRENGGKGKCNIDLEGHIYKNLNSLRNGREEFPGGI